MPEMRRRATSVTAFIFTTAGRPTVIFSNWYAARVHGTLAPWAAEPRRLTHHAPSGCAHRTRRRRARGTCAWCGATIWEQTWAHHPFLPWEFWLGDLGYLGALGILVKWKRRARRRGQPPPLQLTQQQLFYNNVHEHYRNRAENVVRLVKSHRLFRPGCYRGSYAHLEPLLAIAGHATALHLRLRQRFETAGPWRHAY